MTEQLWGDIDEYFEAALVGNDAVLEEALAASAAAGLPPINVSPCQGKLLYLLTIAQGASRVLEVGTLGGYSGIWLARALRPSGKLITLEVSPRHAEVARQNFARAGVGDRVEVHLAPALETLDRLRADGASPFDLVFIDADKPNNLNYVQAALALARPGTLIIVDNVVRGGAVLRSGTDAAADGVRRMTQWIAREPRLSATVIQTVGTKGHDGFLLARVQ